MGELVYTNSDGLEKASADFMEVVGKIAEARTTLYTALDNFTADMLGNAFKPMRNCATQIDGELQCATEKFSAISRLMMTIMYTRSGIDSALGMNAAGKISGTAAGQLFGSQIVSARNTIQQQLKTRSINK